MESDTRISWESFAEKYGFSRSPNNFIRNIELISVIGAIKEELIYPYLLFPEKVYEEVPILFSKDYDNKHHITYEFLRKEGLRLNEGQKGWELIPFVSPFPPSRPTRKVADKDYETKYTSYNWGCLSIIIICWLLTGFIGYSIFEAVEGFFYFLLWIPFVIAIIYKEGIMKGRTKYKTVKRSKREIQLIQNNLDKEFEEKNKSYEQTLKNYWIKKKDYDNKITIQKNLIENNLEFILNNQIKTRLVNNDETVTLEKDPPQRGRMENKLFEALMIKYPSYVKVNRKKGYYYPDIVLQINNESWIDIEVDEPYEFSNKEEIHYIGCGDESRNDFFTSEGWFVLRFSEMNLANNFNECIELVSYLVNFIRTLNPENIKDFLILQNKISHNQWSLEEARLMAIQNSRNKY